MTDTRRFIENFLSHAQTTEQIKEYNRQYYLRKRQLTGRKGGASSPAISDRMLEENLATGNDKLASDLKKAPKVTMNKKRRIGEAEQKLIRAKSLAARVPDPVVRKEMLAKIAETEAQLTKIQQKAGLTPKPELVPKPVVKANPESNVGYNGKPLKKLGSRMEEDETPKASPTGSKLDTFDSGKHGLGVATYKDGSVYDAKVGWTQPATKLAKKPARSIGPVRRK